MAGKPDSEVKAMEAAFNALSNLKLEEKKRAVAWLWEKLELGGATPANTQSPLAHASLSATPNVGAASAPGGAQTAKSFLVQKDPQTDAERVTCLAYYMTHFKATPQFKTKELKALNIEAAQPPFSNPAVAVMNAAASRYLSPAGGGKKQITVQGERLVDALPDREKVKSLPSKRRRKSGRRKGSRA